MTAGTLAAYVAYTLGITSWRYFIISLSLTSRTKFRKEMNATENEAASKAMDSLLNYETVKVIGYIFRIYSSVVL